MEHRRAEPPALCQSAPPSSMRGQLAEVAGKERAVSKQQIAPALIYNTECHSHLFLRTNITDKKKNYSTSDKGQGWVNDHCREGKTEPTPQHAAPLPAFPGRGQLMVSPPKPHLHSSLVHEQRSHSTGSRHTKVKLPCSVGTWWEAVFQASRALQRRCQHSC